MKKPRWKQMTKANVLTDQVDIAIWLGLAVYMGEQGYTVQKIERRVRSINLVRDGIHPRTGGSLIQ